MSAPQNVQIYAVTSPKPRSTTEGRRYRVKWRIDGKDKTRSLKTKAQAERLRAELLRAVASGQWFDPATGEPGTWERSEETWISWAQKWILLKWPHWSGNSRRSAVESLVALTPFLVRGSHSRVPEDLGAWLRQDGFNVASSPRLSVELHPWLKRNSILLVDIEPSVLEAALTGATTKLDGSTMAVDVVRRRRTTLNSVLKASVRRGILESNPMDRIEWRAPERTLAIDISTVPSFLDVVEIVQRVWNLKTSSARYATLFAFVGMAGLRPSEAMGLHAIDLELPDSGWGLARLRGATTSPGSRFVSGGGTHEDKALKQRAPGVVRPVPLTPALVEQMRYHLERFPPVDGRVFTTATGRPMSSTSYSKTWQRARALQFAEGSQLISSTLYDLRHSAATLMLQAGVPPAEAARRLGHSVDVLLRIYAGVLEDERDRSNSLIEQEQRGQLRGP